ncbi:unnamed protein product, partial [Ectocarpus sp. 6 AP-2014]
AVYKIPPQGALANQRTACHKCFSLSPERFFAIYPTPQSKIERGDLSDGRR